MSTPESDMATAALDTLHGARSLPPAEAAERLRDFLDSISSPVLDSKRLAEASTALRELITQLEEVDAAASDDDWQNAIETMQSLANEAS
jgi:hypothetical protein